MMRRSSLVVGALAVACLAGCGSTVQYTGTGTLDSSLGGTQTGSTTSSGQSGLGTTNGTTSSNGSVGTYGLGNSGNSGSTSSDGSSNPGAYTGSNSSGSNPSNSDGATVSGNGKSGKSGTGKNGGLSTGGVKAPVIIGVVTFPDVNAAAAEFGGSADTGSQSKEISLAINYVNSHGGLAGHKIVDHEYPVSLTSTQTYSTEYQEACENFIQYKVQAVLFIGGTDDSFATCLQRAGILLLDHGSDLRTEADWDSLKLLAGPDEVDSNALASAMVTQMLNKGVVKSGTKLGILEENGPGLEAATNQIAGSLKSHGVTTVTYNIGSIASTPAIADAITQVQDAELKFAAEGVKVVTFMCPGCASFFIKDAASQHYTPRYVLTSLDGLYGFDGAGEGGQLANSLSLSWEPESDEGIYSHPSIQPGNKSLELCKTIEKSQVTNDSTAAVAYGVCGSYLEFQAMADKNPVNPINGAALINGYVKLGASFDAVSNVTTFISPERRWGDATYQLMTYGSGCDCLSYSSPTKYPFNS